MTIYLKEDCFGVDADILFLNVQTCLAIIVEGLQAQLGGYHLTLATSATLMRQGGQRLVAHIGATSRVVCVGNLLAFQNQAAHIPMVYPNALRDTLREAFAWAGNVHCFDASPYVANAANGGATVRALQNGGQTQYFVGPHTALGPSQQALCNSVLYRGESQ